MWVSNDTTWRATKLSMETRSRIELEQEVKAYIQDLKFALNNGARIDFQARRKVDEKREERYTNQYTVEALKRELLTLSVEEYMRTVKISLSREKRNAGIWKSL